MASAVTHPPDRPHRAQSSNLNDIGKLRTRTWIRAILLVVVVALGATACRTGADVVVERSDRPITEGAEASNGAASSGIGSDPAPASESDGDDRTGGGDDAGTESQGAADSSDSTATPSGPTDAPPSDLPRALDVTAVDCVAPTSETPASLTAEGRQLFASYDNDGVALPAYEMAVDVNPETGQVAGAMRAVIPAQERTINFRVFAGMEAFDAGLIVDDVTVNNEPVDGTLNQALLSLPAPLVADAANVVELTFEFTIDQMAANPDFFGALTGQSLQPDQVGLLGRTATGMQLGHWFPIWLPDGTRTDPDPSGFGDIGAFPAANICATITVPSGYQVVTGGTRIDTNGTSVIEAGAGLRDFSMLVSNDLLLAARFVEGIEVRVWGPTANPAALKIVLDYADQSLVTLTEAFGPYPWKEIDIISAPLGAGVGGMEWPGAIWIEQSMFAGGLPGVGDLGDLFGDGQLDSILEASGGAALATALEWTVAHELGHEWWHATVGNDSIESPAVDEPLAQFAACLVMETIHPDNWREICDAQTIEQYAQARALGVNDTIAEQASDQFESSLQYGAVVYGKAPGFYYAAAELIGWDELVSSLRGFVEENAFSLVSTNALRSHLVEAAGSDGQPMADLWDRWFREAKGDEDIETANALEAFGGLEGLEGLESLEGLEGLDGLDLSEFFGEDFDIEALLGEDVDLDDLLGDLLEASEDD